MIRRVSKKRQKVDRIYSKEAKTFREENENCAIRSPRCTGRTEGVHHVRGRGIYLLDKTTWKPACNACNLYVEDNHKWAVDNGHKESRLNKDFSS